jgi:hypothetical protein
VPIPATGYGVGPATNRSEFFMCPVGSYCSAGERYPCPAGRFGNETGMVDRTCKGACVRSFVCRFECIREWP